MADKEYEEDDPMALVGVAVSGPEAARGLVEMARVFIDEFARMGWDRERIHGLFRNPFYRGPHVVYERYGDEFVLQLIGERLPGGG